MNILRFIFPFLFARNWFDGQWEFSRARFILFAMSVALVILGLVIVHILQSPAMYTASNI